MRRFNEETARMKRGARIMKPTLSMSSRAAFKVNAPLRELLGCKVGDKVEIIEDEGEWYITKSKVGLMLNKVRDDGAAQFHSRILHQALAEATAQDRGSILVATHPVDVQGMKCFALLLSSVQ